MSRQDHCEFEARDWLGGNFRREIGPALAVVDSFVIVNIFCSPRHVVHSVKVRVAKVMDLPCAVHCHLT